MTTELPEGQLRQLLGYIGVVRDALRMQNWDIILHRTEHDRGDDVWAHTWASDNHHSANIQIAAHTLSARPETIRNTIVHELIHAQHRDVTMLWEACTINNSSIAVSESTSWDGDFHIQMERFVSWATTRIERTVPEYDPDVEYDTPVGCYLVDENPG